MRISPKLGRAVPAAFLATAILSAPLHPSQPRERGCGGHGEMRLDTRASGETPVAMAAPPPLGPTPCTGGFAGPYPCDSVDILSFMPVDSFGAAGLETNDIWGWTDPVTGREYVVLGTNTGTAFIDVTDPEAPVWLGSMPTETPGSSINFRDVKVLGDHAVVVADIDGHGLQLFDLKNLRNVTAPPLIFSPSAVYTLFGHAHNVAVDEESEFIYAISTDTCGGGMHIVDASNPDLPSFAGCVDDDGLTHDAQCLVYRGPDPRFQGSQICLTSSSDTLNIYDVTDKSAPVRLARLPYTCASFVHQGWITEDHRFFLVDDEGDEATLNVNTRTYIFDVTDLTDPMLIGVYESATASSIDHNLYVHEAYAYEANYSSGLRILDLADVHSGQLSEAGFLDIDPNGDALGFIGAWSVYPFFPSGTVAVSVIEQGLFLVRPTVPPDYVLETDTEVIEICEPAAGEVQATVRARLGFTGNVTLDVSDLDPRASATFDQNPVSPTASATLTLDASGSGTFTDAFLLTARKGSDRRERQMTLRVADSVPAAASPGSPSDGATGVSVRPVFMWAGDARASRYRLEVAADPGFTQVILDVTVPGTSHQIDRPLLAGVVRYWRVTAQGACGTAPVSSVSSFTTGGAPSILLVDDDDNCPDVRGSYTGALTALGRTFDVWDTGRSSLEPGPAVLSGYDSVIWFSGFEYLAAGPEAAAESALAPWLDGSSCLLISSQDYLDDHGLTTFMQDYLGAWFPVEDVTQRTVTGGPPFFGGLGPYTLSLPYPNFTDRIPRASGSSEAFSGDKGPAGVFHDTGVYRAGYLGFGLEGLPVDTDRQDVLGAFLGACDALPAIDGDGDGVVNGQDCSPSGSGLWLPPEEARDLGFEGTGADVLVWTPPLDPGALTPLYDVLRSTSDPGFASPVCLEVGGTNTSARAPDDPPPGEVFIYAIRVRNGCGEEMGSTSDGSPRVAPVCSSSCGDGVRSGFELCDGSDLGGETCQSQGFDGGTLGCNASCDEFVLSSCTTVCGNGVRSGFELCDGSDLGGETCAGQGFDGGSLACDLSCTSFDLSGCTTVCGDGVRRGFEECDGSDLAGETCQSLGLDGGSLACDGTCSFDLSGCTTVCGDGVRKGTEVCDGADLGGESCLTQGFDGGSLACSPTCDALDTSACTICGNNIREGAEICDGTDLGGETCHSQGFSIGGTLGCKDNCNGFDTSGCEPL